MKKRNYMHLPFQMTDIIDDNKFIMQFDLCPLEYALW